GPGETRPFGSNPMGNEAGVPLGFHFGRTIMTHEIMGGQVTSEVKEKSPHLIATRGRCGRSGMTKICRGCDRWRERSSFELPDCAGRPNASDHAGRGARA